MKLKAQAKKLANNNASKPENEAQSDNPFAGLLKKKSIRKPPATTTNATATKPVIAVEETKEEVKVEEKP
eukprot:CAMPEP_0176366252 /NCGR_PEP_ID=MMETSP0126-20121128/21052_1 /TAXON_ID=141414 ORGANISM="Strombidinopsis acuminatum, Strain SPMC142" /NCGR_SAMPLE_ID=MMETSP0126 /ASSEMBLY_ACC=CAM_ASM_000229 /LENGTH=69 /DNA_ID=CAMNT_0017723603 /DNA_START=1848 /DNA_END=2057 /DNA_ORIENTATION=+